MSTPLTRTQAAQAVLAARRRAGLRWADLGKAIGMSTEWKWFPRPELERVLRTGAITDAPTIAAYALLTLQGSPLSPTLS